jgi:hypothetical protein
MNKIELAIAYKQRQQVNRYMSLFLITFALIGTGFSKPNYLLIIIGIIPAFIIGYLINLNYKQDLKYAEYIKDIRRKKILISKNIKMNDREILLLNKEGDFPENGFNNLICVNICKSKIFWMANLLTQINVKYIDIDMSGNLLEALTSNNYIHIIDPDTGEIIHSKFKDK